MSTNISDTRFRTAANGQRLRWSPPATKVQIGMVSRVLTRKLAKVTPECRLVLSIITQAMVDCRDRCDCYRFDAQRFLAGQELDLWCDLVDLDAEFVRMVALRSGFWADESQLWTPIVKIRRTSQSTPKVAGEHAGL